MSSVQYDVRKVFGRPVAVPRSGAIPYSGPDDVTMRGLALVSLRHRKTPIRRRSYVLWSLDLSHRWTVSAPGSAPPRCNSRVMTRTASDNSVLSLGSCINAAVTVLSRRTVAPLSSRSCLALTNKAWLIASQVWARIAAIVWCNTDFFGDHRNGRLAKARNEAESSR